MIALIDYGAGNLTSVKKALHAVGVDFVVPDAPTQVRSATGIIVPGVGHFSATSGIDDTWRDTIGDAVTSGTPLLGICVGMQWLFQGSDEAPGVPGLGVLDGTCRLLKGNAAERLKVPHVGWNALETEPRPSRLLRDVDPGAYVYFTHSYAAPVTGACVAATTHAERFAAAVEHEQVFGVQFHPEKSGTTGLRLLSNFMRIVEAG